MTDGPHRLALVTEDRQINFYGVLKELEEMDDRLLRCHQSYIVNKLKVVSYEAEQKMLVLHRH
jgi:two-component system, LytTR family, response regulator AgrA